MSTPRISVIIPLRDRAGARVENCLRSLLWQDVDADSFEIVLSDFGSSPKYARALVELGERFGARIVRSDTDAIWNRARALNIGIRAARGEYVFCTDADMIFQPNFLSTLLAHQDGESFVVCRCRDLPESVPEQAWGEADFDALLAKSDYRERLGTGACQMARRSFFERVHGYDEGYIFWGCEDGDMWHRSQRAGLATRWIHDHTAMLHQWHPTMRTDRPLLKAMNDTRYHLTKWIVVKNRFGWGQA